MGLSMTETPTGRNSFVNLNGDSIHIETLAQSGDEWTVFSWANGNMIKGTVTDESTQQVSGISQIVKTIRLDVVNALGNPMSHPLNGLEWKVSQFSGLVQVHSLYWFPDFPPVSSLPTYACISWDHGFEQWSDTLFTISDVQPVTYGDMYRLFPGDHFQMKDVIQYSGWPDPNPPTITYFDYTVLSRTINVSGGLDLVMVLSTFEEGNPNFTIDTLNLSVPDTGSYFPNGILIGHMDTVFTILQRSELLIDSLDCGSRIVLTPADNTVPNDMSGCYAFYSQYDLLYRAKYYRIGFPFLNWDYLGGFGASGNRSIVYANTTACQFGTQVFVGVNEISDSDLLALWPNPTSGAVRFNSDRTRGVTITDLAGRTVHKAQAQAGQNEIDLSTLSNGCYLIRFEGVVKGTAVVVIN